MTETSLSKPGTVNTIFTKEYPVSFRVLGGKHEEWIYLENEPSSGLLEITNNSGANIYFIPSAEPSKIAGPDNFHFALKFRPGILQTTIKSLIKNKLIKKGWALSIGLVSLKSGKEVDENLFIQAAEKKTANEIASEEVTTVLYFLNTNKAVFTHDRPIILPLKHLHLDCEQGTQVTKVELICNNLAGDKSYQDPVHSRRRHYDLTIINHRGSPVMPVHLGFVGFNAILNDGITANELKLRITNLQRKTPESDGTFTFSHRKHSKIYLYFKTDMQRTDDALSTANNVAAIGMEIIHPHQKKNNNLIHEPLFQGDTPVWEIFPEDGDVVLQPHLETSSDPVPGLPDDSCMDITLSGIRTDFLMGVTYLFLQFENIPGYWDHTYSIPIVKQPLIFVPTFNLMFDKDAGGLYEVIKRLLLNNKIPEQKIPKEIKKDTVIQTQVLKIDAENIKQRLEEMNVVVTLVADKEERVGIGTATPKNKLSVNGTIDFAGNLGIGTTSPLGPLSIGDSSVLNSDGYLIIGKKSDTGTRHFRIGFDGSFNFRIGDYGYENLATTWKSPFAIAWNAPDNCLFIKDNGNVGIGTDQPNQKLEIGVKGGLGFSGAGLNAADKKLYSPADGDLEWMTNNSAGAHGFAISHQGSKVVYLNTSGNSYFNGGNVGIGTSSPLGPLSIGDSSIANSNGYLVIGKKDSSAGTRHFRMGFDESFNFRIGDYGSDNKAAAWRSPFAIAWDAPDNCLFIKNNGSVGIGTTNPAKARLEISGPVVSNYTYLGGIGEVNGKYSSNLLGKNDNWATAIFAEGHISAKWFVSHSDMRSKKIIGRSDSSSDLETIKKIGIVDYQMKDEIAHGNAVHKKVIAQQVKDVFPAAVTASTNVVPDIYQHAYLENGWVKLSSDLCIGEKVQLIFENEKEIFEVAEASESGFRIASGRVGNVFVYGREVDDFLSVDYEAISMLNVSATQELSKQVEHLRLENQKLRDEQEKMKREMDTIKKTIGVKMDKETCLVQ